MPSDFPELTDPEGRLERRGAWETLFVPMDFWLDGARLWWGYEGPLPYREVEPGEGLLSDFAGLADATPATIAAFARRWGALQFCEHDRPASHNPFRPGTTGGGFVDWCTPLGWFDRTSPSPAGALAYDLLATWHEWATDVAALLRIAARTRDNLPGRGEDWALVFRRTRVAPWWHSDAGDDRPRLAQVVGELAERVGVRPLLRYRPGGTELRLGGGGLFGAVVIQLMTIVTSSNGPYTCAGCGTFFEIAVQARKPQRGRGSYCSACRKSKIPQRLASRRHRCLRAGGPRAGPEAPADDS